MRRVMYSLVAGVVLTSVQHHGVQRAVELSVAAAVQPVPLCLAARGGDRRDTGEAGEGGFVADAATM